MCGMAINESKQAAEFFIAIWQSLCAEAGIDTSQDERRSAARFPFHTMQLAAPLESQSMPTIDSFRTIQCQDISSGGFSYYADQPPTSEKVILLIQTGGCRHCVEGEIVHRRPIYRQGRAQFLIGCQFTRRIGLPGEPA